MNEDSSLSGRTGRSGVILGDCLEVMRGMASNSVDLILTDPPYFKVKADWWDRQWEKPAAFLEWLEQVLSEFQRILKPNGSLYIFASPQMAARVEVAVSERFSVLNHIVWRKESTRHKQAEKEMLRSYFPQTERIIFAEQYGADNRGKGALGYKARSDELRGTVFEPLRAYLADEWARAGLTPRDVNIATSSQMSTHYLTAVQWAMPTPKKYSQLQEYANRNGGAYLQRPYEDIKAEYEVLRERYEAERQHLNGLRRPFAVTPQIPHTDVWDFPVVQAYAGKHPCEKPLSLLEHIISVSSRPGAVVFDAFAGSGATGEAAVKLGREFIGCEIQEDWARRAQRRVQHAQPALLGVG